MSQSLLNEISDRAHRILRDTGMEAKHIYLSSSLKTQFREEAREWFLYERPSAEGSCSYRGMAIHWVEDRDHLNVTL